MATFQTAVTDSRKLKAKPSDNELLEMYGLFKIGEGEDITKAEAPGMFDLKGKAKRKAWQKLVDEGCTLEEAKQKYVGLVEGFKEKYGFDADKVPEEVGGS